MGATVWGLRSGGLQCPSSGLWVPQTTHLTVWGCSLGGYSLGNGFWVPKTTHLTVLGATVSGLESGQRILGALDHSPDILGAYSLGGYSLGDGFGSLRLLT